MAGIGTIGGLASPERYDGGTAAKGDTNGPLPQTGIVQQPSSDRPVSPRVTVDPVAGVILQFLDNRGQVQSQVPSFARVAYLKADLTRDGGARNEETDSQAITV